MKLEYKNGMLSIDLDDVLNHLSLQEKREIATLLAVQDDIIKDVVDQILEEWTDDGHRGGMLCTASANPEIGLDWAFREISKRSSEVAKKEINRLEDALSSTQMAMQELTKRYGTAFMKSFARE